MADSTAVVESPHQARVGRPGTRADVQVVIDNKRLARLADVYPRATGGRVCGKPVSPRYVCARGPDHSEGPCIASLAGNDPIAAYPVLGALLMIDNSRLRALARKHGIRPSR